MQFLLSDSTDECRWLFHTVIHVWDHFSDDCIKLNDDSVIHFEFIKLSKDQQSLLVFLVVWFELIFHLSALLNRCTKKLKLFSDSYGFT